MKQQRAFTIPIPERFNFKECLWFLNRDFDDCMHAIEGDTVVKALPLTNQPVLFRISGAEHSLYVELLEGDATPEHIAEIHSFITAWFDLDRDIQPFYTLLGKEKKLAYMAESFNGLHLTGLPDLFEALCWGIIGQQINLTFAYRLKRRLVERYGTYMTSGERQYYLFPEPAVLAAASVDELRAMQYSQRKAEYLLGLASLFATGQMSKGILENIRIFAARQQALTAIRGIGIWTANYALMKSLRMPEAVPYGDAGLLQALVAQGLIRDRKDQAGMDKLFRKFRGWEMYLVFYLWRSLSLPQQV